MATVIEGSEALVLIGSEAQVAWAMDIRAKLLGQFDGLRERGLADFDAMMAPLRGMDEAMDAEMDAERAALEADWATTRAAIFGHQEAGWWINVADRRRLADLIADAKSAK